MEWGYVTELLRREHQRPGCCIACDTPLPIKPAGEAGRKRTLLCGEPECLTTFNAMFKSMKRELEQLGRRSELEQATALLRASASAMRRANRTLERTEEGARHATA